MIPRRPLIRLAHVGVALGVTLSLAGCGSDDDSGADAPTGTNDPVATEPVATEPVATEPDATEPQAADTSTPETAPSDEGDVAAFCAAEVDIETAISSEGDPSEAIAAASAAAPPDVAPALDTVLTEFEANGGESDEFTAAYSEMITWMKGNCGFGSIEATATEYAFAGIPDEVPAGPTIVSLTNLGEEFHELLMLRKNDGVSETFDEIVALDEAEAMALATVQGVAFAPNGAEGQAVVDLTPGDYLAICFLPTGATPELMAQMSGPDSSLPPGAGPPHFTHGMMFEFTVS